MLYNLFGKRYSWAGVPEFQCVRNFQNILAETHGVRVDDSPRYFTSIDIKYIIYSKDLTESEADRYISLSLEKYCSVGATINDKTKINHSFQIIR